MKDSIGDRIKSQYEDRYRFKLPRRTYTIIRIDGKGFHKLLQNCDKPFDCKVMDSMDYTAKFLCREIQCAKLAFIQSDEINLLLADFDTINTEMWFNGNLQKIVSVSASLATGIFNKLSIVDDVASFDARAFIIPDPVEVENYFIWRQKDATKNSIQMVARSLYSHEELIGKKVDQLQEMIFQKGQNWNNYAIGSKRGRCIIRLESGWERVEPPIFTQDREFLRRIIDNIRKD
jgi:tRNA(His) 5'-end guanylyltransferase